MRSRVKVSTDKLLAAVEARREKAIKDHAKALERWDRDGEKLNAEVAKTLRAAAERAERGILPDGGYNYLSIPWKGRLDRKPSPKADTSRIDRVIQTLKMAAEPTITISSDDAALYLD